MVAKWQLVNNLQSISYKRELVGIDYLLTLFANQGQKVCVISLILFSVNSMTSFHNTAQQLSLYAPTESKTLLDLVLQKYINVISKTDIDLLSLWLPNGN